MIGRAACKNQNGDFCLIIWNDFRYSVYRGLDPDIEFSYLFGQKLINDLLYQIGGHKYAVSVHVVPGIKNRLKAMFRFRLGPEAERFVELLQETF